MPDRDTRPVPIPIRLLLAAVTALVVAAAASGNAGAAGPYVFCDRDYSAYDTCVGGNAHFLRETQARDLNGSNRVCATQKSGPYPSSSNQYSYACANYSAGVINSNSLLGHPAAHNGENWSQIMRGQFYL
jgi:hypothetical protein